MRSSVGVDVSVVLPVAVTMLLMPTERAALVHAVPLLWSTLPFAPGATATTFVGVMMSERLAMT
jgi:hypothetical protein